MLPGWIEELKAEKRRLEEELAEDPRQQKIQAIDDLLDLYADDAREEAPKAPRPKLPPGSVNTVSKAARIKARVHELLADGPKHRADILKVLIDAGIMGSEANPMASLAAYLSEWKADFTTDGKGNFSLATQREESPNEQVSASS